MNSANGRYEKLIVPLKRRYWLTTVLFLILVTFCVAQERHRIALEETRKGLIGAGNGIVKVREAALDRKHALDAIKAQLEPDDMNSSVERRIYGKADEIKKRLKPDEMTIAAIENKGGDALLPYTIKFIDPEYDEFLDAAAYLQNSVFPFAPVKSITVSQSEENGKGAVVYTLDGSVQTPAGKKP